MSSPTGTTMSSLQRLRAAVTDGRTENVRYRQKQLMWLHTALRESAEPICAAISKDSKCSSYEVEVEYYLAMTSIKELYDSLSLEKSLEEEYLVRKGQDNTKRRVGLGLVVIRPATHTRFYSVLSALSAAIAAGNCVLLELGDNLLNLDAILKDILTKTLDQDSFACISKPVSDDELSTCFLVDQNSPADSGASISQLLSSSKAGAVAFVDRTADIALAAKTIVSARYSFGGTSPYAPKLVVVNEFVRDKFDEECSKWIDSSEIVKVKGKQLNVTSSRSLMDSVYSQKSDTPLLAAYLFASPANAKFMAQHLSPHISFVNQIPNSLLLGPAAPLSHDSTYPSASRYTPAMFSALRPQFIRPSASVAEKKVAGLIVVGKQEVDALQLKKLRDEATTPLKKINQGPGHAIGFFEQGMLAGAAVWLFAIIPVVGYGSFVLGRRGWQMAMKR